MATRSISRQSGARMATPTPCICPSSRLSSYRSGVKVATLVFGRGRVATRGTTSARTVLDAKLNFDKPWRIHDIRRRVATHMAELGILPHIVEATLNHLSGHKSGIAGVYNRATYDTSAPQALDKWARAHQADPGADALEEEPRGSRSRVKAPSCWAPRASTSSPAVIWGGVRAALSFLTRAAPCGRRLPSRRPASLVVGAVVPAWSRPFFGVRENKTDTKSPGPRLVSSVSTD